jgi:hypothetical protein
MISQPEYLALPVSTVVFEQVKLRSQFEGGTVVDGIYDDVMEQSLLIIRIDKSPLTIRSTSGWRDGIEDEAA